MKHIQEADLYLPLKTFLTAKGLEVKGEVQHCDIVAIHKDGSIIVIELKLSLNLTILLQAVDRLKITDTVYIGIPHNIPVLKKNRKRIIKLVRMLGLGLIAIDPKSKLGNVDILCEPGAYVPRQLKRHQVRLLSEFHERNGDPNLGGSRSKGGLLTAYRQKAIAIAAYLQENGNTKAATAARALDETKTRAILYDNVYGWFNREGGGVYGLSTLGKTDLKVWVARKL